MFEFQFPFADERFIFVSNVVVQKCAVRPATVIVPVVWEDFVRDFVVGRFFELYVEHNFVGQVPEKEAYR